MARIIIPQSGSGKGKRYSVSAEHVAVHVGTVANGEYYELRITATDNTGITVERITSANPEPATVYRIPAPPRRRRPKTAPVQTADPE